MGRYHRDLPPLAAQFIRYVLGFSISVGLGLAPYLGKLEVPGFSPMLSLIPDSLQDTAIPLSSAVMGIVTIWVQWHGSVRPGNARLSIWFMRTLKICTIALFVLIAIELLAVVRLDIPAVNRTVAFAIGPIHPHTPPCEILGRSECIKYKLSLDESHINSYFGETQANCTKLMLVLTYVIFMSSFGMLIGILMVKQNHASVIWHKKSM
jgi:hypothetical protein